MPGSAGEALIVAWRAFKHTKSLGLVLPRQAAMHPLADLQCERNVHVAQECLAEPTSHHLIMARR